MEPMDVVERLKVDIEMLSMSPDENERLISETLKLALSEIETLRQRLSKNSITDYVNEYWKEEDYSKKYKQFNKIKFPPINKL